MLPYILGRIETGPQRVILINLEDGNAWRFRGCSVKDENRITEEEFSKITGREDEFELVEEREEV